MRVVMYTVSDIHTLGNTDCAARNSAPHPSCDTLGVVFGSFGIEQL